MYLAELRGKLSPRIEASEDILTSNVFSFFKYDSRDVFLKEYLKILGFDISEREARGAKFLFWPRLYEDYTEPDLVMIVGNYYLLVEAKYFSDFAEGTQKTKAQLIREVNNGINDAKNYGKVFSLIAITADSYEKEERLSTLPIDLRDCCVWTNWQTVAEFLYKIIQSNPAIEQEESEFATDLYNLLDKKHLRNFQGLGVLDKDIIYYKTLPYIFFDAKTAKFRGDFIGFNESLWQDKKLTAHRFIFLDKTRELFQYHKQLSKKLRAMTGPIFYKEVKSHGRQE
jgi:hypothetical protein